ncbi:MAG: FkbM family methyltransferase [Anaerolineaceae bacterium]|nr:FkbM family methyltransferase [Anaerolineaceae bacterium]
MSETDFADKVTYIKADIESFEYKMLKGAEKTIKNNKPRLAICIYHNAVDMYSILLLIHRINPDYRFSVRHHSFTLSETVLYAY